jgi:serine-aspartate repeat-containing protein C/D/E
VALEWLFFNLRDMTMSKSNAKATLGGTVWNDVNHDGIQNDGNIGLAGIRVILLNSEGKSAGKYTFTDADGNYSFAGLNAGNYSVKFDKASLPVGATFAADHEGNNNNIDSDANYLTGKTGIIHLNAGQINNSVDAGIMLPQVASSTISGHIWSDLNANGIHEASEPARPDIYVDISRIDGSAIPQVVATILTDSNGAYSYTSSGPGQYIATVPMSPTYELTLDHIAGNDAMSSAFSRTTGSSNIIDLSAGKSSTLDAGIVLPGQIPPGTVNGHVWKDVNSNGIQDPGEPGLAGATVIITASSRSGTISHTGVTDSNGDYVVTEVPAGTSAVLLLEGNGAAGYTNITAQHQGTNPNLDSDYDPNLSGSSNTITVQPDGTSKFDIGLAKDPLISIGAIRGVWLDADGNSLKSNNVIQEPGIEGVTVTLISLGTDGLIGGGDDTDIATTMTNANGDYNFANVENLDHALRFSMPGSTIHFSPRHDDNLTRGDIISDSDVQGDIAYVSHYHPDYTSAGIISIVGTPAALTSTLVA